jgi:N-acyl-L-homoserine lactone synthetase
MGQIERSELMQVLATEEEKGIAFYEEDLLVRTLRGEADMIQAYNLRHRIFAERLKWVADSPDQLEYDTYDAFATAVGLFDGEGELRGIFRMVNSSFPFMLESEFRGCLPPTCEIRKAPDTAEITRFAIDPALTDKGISNRLMQVLLKGVYQWAQHNDVRYMYLVVEQRFLRALRGMGITCEAIGPAVRLPPAEALSIAAILDWEQFRQTCPQKRPSYYEWMNTIDGSTPFKRSTFVAMDSKEGHKRNEFETSMIKHQAHHMKDHNTLVAA